MGPRSTRSFIVGLFVGASAIAAALWLLGAALDESAPRESILVAGALVAAYLALTRYAPALPYPQNARQVPSWVTEGPPSHFFIFGVEMGTGTRTFAPTALPHLLALTVLVAPTVAVAGGAALGFATGRSLAVPLYRRHRRRSGTGVGFRLAVPRWAQALGCAGWAVVALVVAIG